jgi:hypothetical protein
VESLFEAKRLETELELTNCRRTLLPINRNAFQCVESNETVCAEDSLDLRVLDQQARPDCPAFEVRADVVTRGPLVLAEWDKICSSNNDRAPQHSSKNCSGNQVNRRKFTTWSSRSSTEVSYHWQYHNIRGLTYDPSIIGAGNAFGCKDNTCTADGSLSCWPTPRMRTGTQYYSAETGVFTCDGETGNVHIVGRSSSTYEMQGTIYSVWAANECTVSMPSQQRVRIVCSALAWSDVWINQLGNYTLVTESADFRNVCEQ